jgi:hypothetical protein
MDPDPDLDRHQSGKSDQDRHQDDADAHHCCISNYKLFQQIV